MCTTDWKTKHKRKQNNAQERGLEYNLTKDDWLLIMENYRIGGICDYSGVVFDHHHLPSIERIDDKKGYVRGNIAVVSEKVNTLKDLLDKGHIHHGMTQGQVKLYNYLARDKGEPFNKLKEELKNKYNPEKQGKGQDLQTDEQPVMVERTETREVNNMNTEKTEATQVSKGKKHDEVLLAARYGRTASRFTEDGADFDLSFSQYKAKLKRKKCPMTGVTFGTTDETRPVLIQLDNSLPVTSKNCLLVCGKVYAALSVLNKQAGYSNKDCVQMFASLQKASKGVL